MAFPIFVFDFESLSTMSWTLFTTISQIRSKLIQNSSRIQNIYIEVWKLDINWKFFIFWKEFRLWDRILFTHSLIVLNLFQYQGYEGSLLKVTSKNGKTSSVSNIDYWRQIYYLSVSLRRVLTSNMSIDSRSALSHSPPVPALRQPNKIYK